MTKDSLKFTDVHKWLHNLLSSRSASSNPSDSKAYSVKEQPKKEEKEKDCTWSKTCGRKFKANVYSECFRLKKYKE